MQPRSRFSIIRAMILADAFGYPVNGLKGGHITQLAGTMERILPDGNLFPDRPDRYRHAGLHGAASQHAIAVFSGFAPDAMGRTPVGVVGARLLELAGAGEGSDVSALSGSLRAPGRPLRAAVARWRAEFPWDGNDFLARRSGSKGAFAVPAGLAMIAAGGASDDPQLHDLVRLTHERFEVQAAAYAVARLAELLLAAPDPRKLDTQDLLDQLIADTEQAEERLLARFLPQWREYDWTIAPARFSEVLAPLRILLREGRDDLVESALLQGIERFDPDCAVTQVTHGFAPVLVPFAIYRALGALSPQAVLEDIARRGMEVSLTGMIAAGLLAARWGNGPLPELWIPSVTAWPLLDQIEQQGDAYSWDEWTAAEADWSAQESARRSELQKRHDAHEAKQREKGHVSPPKKPSKEPEFAPPPPEWLGTRSVHDLEDPRIKKQLKEARARRRIDWKEDRRDAHRRSEDGDGED